MWAAKSTVFSSGILPPEISVITDRRYRSGGFGYLSVCEAGGYYSLNVRDVEISGGEAWRRPSGALFEKLEKEGLFDPEYKTDTGISAEDLRDHLGDGAAVRDILKIIRSEKPIGQAYWSIRVWYRGKSAAADIADAIVKVNEKFPTRM